MKISVLVPTYKRSNDLERCLNALKQQSLPADEVLVVVRETDEETHRFFGGFDAGLLPLKIVDVFEPGQVAALNAGLAAATGDIISITDDDAAPHGHWLEMIRQHFIADPSVGGVGGRDWVYIDNKLLDSSYYPGGVNPIGRISWFGRVTGNHHLGEGHPRMVDILKGANMSYRSTAIHNLFFDKRLLGSGAQFCNDMAFSFAVKKNGWKLVYDPIVAVDHFPGSRFDEDQREKFNPIAIVNAAHNEKLVIFEYLPLTLKPIFVLWSFFVGSRANPGIAQIFRLTLKGESNIFIRSFYCQYGMLKALRTYLMTSLWIHQS
jgi:GT2 family glycosyltransferase